MKFDKETLIAFVLCMALMLAWPTISKHFGWDQSTQEDNAGEAGTVETVAAAPQTPAAAPAVEKAAVIAPAAAKTAKSVPAAVADVTLSNEDISVVINPAAGMISKITYHKFKHDAVPEKISVINGKYGLFQFFADGWQLEGTPEVHKTADSCIVVRTVNTLQGKLQITQRFSIAAKGYQLKCTVSYRNMEKHLMVLNPMFSSGEVSPWHYVSGDKIRAVAHNLDYFTVGGKHESIAANDDDDDFFHSTDARMQWIAGSNKYFCNIMDLDGKPFTMWHTRYYLKGQDGKEYPVLTVGARFALQLPPGGTGEFEARVYSGPKKVDGISEFIPSASKVMHLAWGPLNYLARFLLWILNLFYGIFHSYGWSIVLLTVLVRAVFYPLTARGNESMKKMQRVQPMFKELREKYKDNPQLLNQKMTELYRKEGVNPFAGCLPILLQIPIFFALYAMLDNVVALRHVQFYWCKNLAAADTIFSIPIFNWSLPVNPLVLVMTALMVVQQRMTPAAMDPAQKKMMALMPVVMLIFLYDLPSGLTLYWTVSNIFSIIQLWLQKRHGSPAPAAPAAGK